MEIVSVEAYNALTGDQMTKANFPKLATIQELLRRLCTICKIDTEETALIYNRNRIDLENITLEQLGVGSEVIMQLLKQVSYDLQGTPGGHSSSTKEKRGDGEPEGERHSLWGKNAVRKG